MSAPHDESATPARGRGTAWLVGALMAAALGLASWPFGRVEPPLPAQAWSSEPQASAAPLPAGPVTVPPVDARTGDVSSRDCTALPSRDAARSQGT